MIALDAIRESFQGKVLLGEELSRHVTFRIGGPADIFLEPVDKEDAVALFGYLHKAKTPYTLLGNGSNVLIADRGIRGITVSLASGFNYVREEKGGTMVAGAGIRLATFVNQVIMAGYGGTEMLAGIPGTLGGAVIMNAGAYGGEISDHMTSVEVMRNGRLQTIAAEDAGFAYRTSDLTDDIVLEARFRFPAGDAESLKKRRKELLVKRNGAQPVQWPNAGSIFKNPEGDFAARLIEECGLKGVRVGGAEISELHSNFIINVENASAEDVMTLVARARREVLDRFGVELRMEVKPIGFESEELDAWGIESEERRAGSEE